MKVFALIAILSVFAICACVPEQEKLTFDREASLRFSTDTVFFDTLFTSMGSVTKRLKVYNDNKNAVEIDKIAIDGGSTSPYTIYVNGKAEDTFEKVLLLGKDSILILIEALIDPTNEDLPFVITDAINFETNGNPQEVQLVSWGQDAHFLRDSVLSCDAIWTAGRPYVIYNSILVEAGCKLTVQPGARIYSHYGSYVFVEGTLEVQGTAENRVIFRNDRFEPAYENAPGQWGGIYFLEGSKENQIHYADIRNAEIGLRIGTPDDDDDHDVVIANTRIENMSNSGILAFTADVYAYNTLVNNCAVNVIGNYAGGNYVYEHCTFTNYSFDFFREDFAVVFSDNVLLADNTVLSNNLAVTLINSIIWGSLNDEILMSNGGGKVITLTLSNNLLKTTNSAFAVNNTILNETPRFNNPRLYDYALDTLSPAKDGGIDIGITNDLTGSSRDASPDIGAFERVE